MGRKKQTPQFVLCIRNEGCDDLELRKVYQVRPDASATEEGYLRLIDESGEDYHVLEKNRELYRRLA